MSDRRPWFRRFDESLAWFQWAVSALPAQIDQATQAVNDTYAALVDPRRAWQPPAPVLPRGRHGSRVQRRRARGY